MCFTIRVADRFASTDFIVKRLHSEQIKYNIDFNYSIYQYINLQHIKTHLKEGTAGGKKENCIWSLCQCLFLGCGPDRVCVCRGKGVTVHRKMFPRVFNCASRKSTKKWWNRWRNPVPCARRSSAILQRDQSAETQEDKRQLETQF